MKILRCAGPGCSILARAVREEFYEEIRDGRCFCREALATMRPAREHTTPGALRRVGAKVTAQKYRNLA
jgi:hypothetical protein